MNENQNNIFLSWSDKKSNAIAHIFKEILPYLIQESRPFFSPEGIKKDDIWFNKIKSELKTTKTGIVFLTKENIKKDWIFFESGGIFAKESICVLLCDFNIEYLKEQDSLFQYLNVTNLDNKEDLLKLLLTISKIISPLVPSIVIKETFNLYYTEFYNQIEQYLDKTTNPVNNTNSFEGIWLLEYKKHNSAFWNQEKFKLTNDGKYILVEKSNDRFYFQLNILKQNSFSIIWQKLNVINDKVIEDVHSIEDLKIISMTELEGTDTLGYKLKYKKIE